MIEGSLLAMRARVVPVAAALLLLTCGFLAEAQSTTAVVTLTVEQAIARALANQPMIQQAQAAVESARARVGEARSSYYPNLSGTASYTRLEPNQTFTFPGLGTFSLAPEDNWDFHLGLNQVITQFGKRDVQVRMAENGVAAARIGVDQARTGIAFQAA